MEEVSPPRGPGRQGPLRPEFHGVLNINKPAGITSHDVVDAVRRILRMKRVGHTGTLDPLATGVLPICVGKATKISQYLIQADKEYRMTMRLGVTTDTLDADGKVLTHTDMEPVPLERLQEVLAQFVGEIHQVPPLFSAKKIHGQRLYRLARRGEVVDRPPVTVRIDEVILLAYEPPLVHFSMRCSKGTYARALCDDIGRVLGCGAYLQNLVRTRSGRFTVEEALSLEDLEKLHADGRVWEVLIPIGEALTHLPAVRILPEFSRGLLHGSSLPASAVIQFPPARAAGTLVRVLGFRQQLLCLAETLVGAAEVPSCDPHRFVLKPLRVFSSQ